MTRVPLDTLLSRLNENTIEAYRVFARTTPGGAIEERFGLVLTDSLATDSMGNVAVATEPTNDPSGLFATVEGFYASHRRPWIVLALPAAVPSLEETARERGFRDEGWFSSLALHPLPSTAPRPPENVEVRLVDSLEELRVFERTASLAYGVESGPVYESWLRYPGFSFHLAYYRGVPVATATLVASHGIAGIVYVGTIPEMRGRGFGRAAVWGAVMAGKALGLETSGLWATPLGKPMYEKMGFRTVTRYRIWSPIDSPLPRAFAPP